MPSAADPVVDEIASRCSDLGRPLRFDEYVEIALYGAHGFYQSTGRAGRRGDFLTSPEVGPLFGEVLARWLSAELDALGSAEPSFVVEVGAGPGSLARSVLQAAPHLADRYIAVECSAAQRAAHPAGVSSSAVMPTGPLRGVIVANELLDNLPFRLAVHDAEWREAHVDVDRNGALAEVLLPAPPEWSWLPTGVPHGTRLPVQQRAAEWVSAAQALLTAGVVMIVDYCVATTADLVERPWRTWLRTYRGHERGAHYLREPGRQDITADVCIDQLPPADAMRTQAQFLRRWGIDDLVDEGRRAWERAASRPDLAALRMRSRVREAESLLDPAGLGGFAAVEWRAHPQ